MRKLVRRITVAAALAELALGLGFIAFLLQDTADPLGASIARGVSGLIGITLAVSTLPGLLLAWWGRLLPVAAALITAGPLLWLYLMANA